MSDGTPGFKFTLSRSRGRALSMARDELGGFFANLSEATRAVVGIAGIVLGHIAQKDLVGTDRPGGPQAGEGEGRS